MCLGAGKPHEQLCFFGVLAGSGPETTPRLAAHRTRSCCLNRIENALDLLTQYDQAMPGQSAVSGSNVYAQSSHCKAVKQRAKPGAWR